MLSLLLSKTTMAGIYKTALYAARAGAYSRKKLQLHAPRLCWLIGLTWKGLQHLD